MARTQAHATQHDFWRYIKPEVRVSVWTNSGGMIPAVVVRLNQKSVTIRLGSGEIKRVPRAAIADLAPGERDRLALAQPPKVPPG